MPEGKDHSAECQADLSLSCSHIANTGTSVLILFIMPPSSMKLEEHIASGAFVRPYVTRFDA